MKIYDCFMYYNEDVVLDLRLNMLNKFVDFFVIVESRFNHKGEEKKLNFDINKYPEFKDKITHLVVETEPNNLKTMSDSNKRYNSIRRIEHQRNFVINYFTKENDNDWLVYSDSDEIPNLEAIDFKSINKKIILFKQKLFYYKFNLCLKSYPWFGSRACKLKNLKKVSALRNIKPKKYKWWRLDTLFKDNKYTSVNLVDDGGWHFSDLKSAKKILQKKQNDEHHDEFEKSDIDEKKIEHMIKNRYITYNHLEDKKNTKQKWSNEIKIIKINSSELPQYLLKNKNKYAEWFD